MLVILWFGGTKAKQNNIMVLSTSDIRHSRKEFTAGTYEQKGSDATT